MTDREALTAALDYFDGPHFPRSLLVSSEFLTVATAARERLAQLPPYSDELVERIAQGIADYGWNEPPDVIRLGWTRLAVAVLDALNGETP